MGFAEIDSNAVDDGFHTENGNMNFYGLVLVTITNGIPAIEKAEKRMETAMEKCEFYMTEAFDCKPPSLKIQKDRWDNE